ncbi:MAG TPA: 4a-hydroxytetrahydrobiopterin dehydratase [Gammaproteobacteria bacterium]|nr:4a-hydroxytetrahydrobiopterin dehydratase [Gammaproteobacteria bacterium]
MDWKQKHCKPCEGGVSPMTDKAIHEHLKSLDKWSLETNTSTLTRTFKFNNFYQTMSFVNAVAWVANQEDHHPDLEVSYGSCTVNLSTHAVNGLTDNDFIMAAKISDLI